MRNGIKAHVILLLVLSTIPVTAVSEKKPAAPPGFSWYVAQNGVGTFLKPDGWYALEQTKGNTHALFLSRESIKGQRKFIAGFTVNQITAYSSNSSIKASEYAKLFIQRVISKNEVINSGVVEGATTDMNVARVKKVHDGVEIIVHHISVGMDNRDELYLISFEAPASEWDSLNPTAGQLFSYFILGS